MNGIPLVAGSKAPAVADDKEHLPISAEVMTLCQRCSVHLGRLRNPHHIQHGRRNIAQTAVPQCNRAAVGGIHQNKGHQIGGMRAVGLSGCGIQLFDVAVVGSHRHHIALGQRIVYHHVQIVTDVPAGLQLGGGVLGVADDVAVGKIGHDKIILSQRFHHPVCHGWQAQLRLLVKVNALGGRDAHVVLAGERGVFAAVEEKGHMGILFAFGAVELALPRLAEHLCQRLDHMGGGKRNGQILELVMVHGHDDKIQILQQITLHPIKIRIGKQLRQLDFPFSPAAAEHGGIPVADLSHGSAIFHQDHRFQMVIIQPCLICFFHGPRQLGAAALGFGHRKYLLIRLCGVPNRIPHAAWHVGLLVSL